MRCNQSEVLRVDICKRQAVSDQFLIEIGTYLKVLALRCKKRKALDARVLAEMSGLCSYCFKSDLN